MYTLRQVTVADYAFLFHLHKASMKDYVTQTWGWDEMVQQTLFQERFEPSRLQIVVVDGCDVGVLSVKQQSDTLVLANLQILPDGQKQGLGTAIIRALLWQASQQGFLTGARKRKLCYTGANEDRCSSQEDLCASAELFRL